VFTHATKRFLMRPSQPIGSRLTHGMSHAPQPQPLNAKATSSAFSQPTGSARRLTTALSLRRGSSFVTKNPAPSELDQKKKAPGLQRLVEEDADNFEDNAGAEASAEDRAAAADPTQPPESDAPVFKSERDAEIRGGSSSSPLRSPHIRQADNGSSPPRRVNFQVQSASGDAESAAAAPSDQLPSGGGSAPPVVAVPPPITQSVKNAAALFKKSAEEKYLAAKGEGEGPHPPGSRRTRPRAAAPSAVAGDKSGWVDKMKKNFVGFFEGGDSDASTSEEEQEQEQGQGQEQEQERSSAAAAAHDAPPSEVDAKLLPSIIAAIKAAQPPLVRTNTRRAFFGTETHPHSFKGCEFVDWLLDPSKAGELTVPSRARAVAIGEAMCSKNLMRGSERGADFKDADVLYRCGAAAGASSRIARRLSRDHALGSTATSSF
jgi:hypothetical protein